MSYSGVTSVFGDLRGESRRLLLLGILDLVVGIVCVAWPGATVLVLAILLGIVLLLTGIAVFTIGLRAHSTGLEIVGIVAVIAAVICLVHPGAGVFAILLGCALWFLLTGIAALVAGSGAGEHRWPWLVLGVLSVIAGIVMLVRPGVAVSTVALIAGVAFLVRGISELGLYWRLRKAL